MEILYTLAALLVVFGPFVFLNWAMRHRPYWFSALMSSPRHHLVVRVNDSVAAMPSSPDGRDMKCNVTILGMEGGDCKAWVLMRLNRRLKRKVRTFLSSLTVEAAISEIGIPYASGYTLRWREPYITRFGIFVFLKEDPGEKWIRDFYSPVFPILSNSLEKSRGKDFVELVKCLLPCGKP